MQYFTDTRETIPAGVGIAQFGPEHLCWLAAVALAVFFLCRAVRGAPEARRKTIRRVLVALLLADEAFKLVMLLAYGNWIPKYLPFHLCSINIFAALANELRSTRLSRELLYATSLPAAFIALLCPTWTPLPVLNFMSIHSFTIHGLLLAYPAVLLAGGDLKPDWRNLKWVLALYAVLLPVLYLFNKRFDTNFMFLNWAEPGTPLIALERLLGTPGYLIGIPLLLALFWLVMYVPLGLVRRRARRVIPKAS